MQTESAAADTVVLTTVRCDTVIRLAPDTAALAALAECDETGQVLINTIRTLQGSRVSVAPQVISRLVPDTTGRVRRVAYLHLMAVADSLRQTVYTLESRRCRSAAQSRSESRTSGRPVWPRLIVMFVLGAAAGVALGMRLAARLRD